MKLATLKDGTRDGALVVVSRDLGRCIKVPQLARNLQGALDRWRHVAPGLAEISDALNLGSLDAEAQAFDAGQCHSPLPRAYQWADGSAYVNHVELVRKARGAEMPASFWTDPLMYQGGSDSFLDPCGDIVAVSEEHGIDFEAEIAVITDDVPMAVSSEIAGDHIRLLLLVNDVSLRNLIPNELAKGFGFFQAKPSSAFSPCAITPDELGDAWQSARVHRPLLSFVNGEAFGKPDAGVDMTFDFGQLVAHAARTRPLVAGSIIGSGTVSNRGADGGPGKAIRDGGLGYSCLAEMRTVETIVDGKPRSPFLKFGDRVRIEMRDAGNQSLFGAIDQIVRPLR
ncbi:fumarylacetoacetate hydrolase family protein [Solimonas terrae]|uniref:Fumarylacetoacetate hydrolase family protein n=1 Tax=Solimonas terrae TaxID=1396819 RepID=A0A6M2BR38_9GAMM|nr:fumarylacetoacetate hydrolase family protein [Solimonas terrae]NGY04948.1 fumarylacetoacetate hydrolase family protein [Solimonas terrae]